MIRSVIRLAALLALTGLVLLTPAETLAERLPVRAYTLADGLPGEDVRRIVRDREGYLWFLTDGGLSRFDGSTFSSFGPQHGLPPGRPRALLQTRDGLFLVGASDGVYWHDPARPGNGPLFRVARPAAVTAGEANTVNALFEDSSGVIWCGTQFGLYRMHRDGEGWSFDAVPTGQPAEEIARNRVVDITEDRDGSLWFAMPGGLLRLGRDGSRVFLTDEDGLPGADVYRLTIGPDDRVWAATGKGIAALETDATSNQPVVVRAWGPAEGLVDPSGLGTIVRDLLFTSDGMLWVGSFGLIRLDPAAPPGPSSLRVFDVPHGLPSPWVMALAEDQGGNVWAGTPESGAFRLARDGLVSYAREDGLRVGRARSFVEDATGALGVLGIGAPLIHTFDGRRFDEVAPELPASIKNMGWGSGQVAFIDRSGEWWFSTFDGLVRFPRVSSVEDLAITRLAAHYTVRDGLVSDWVFKSYEDSHGDVWIGTIDPSDPRRGALQRWNRERETFRTFGPVDGVPQDIPTAFLEDHSGNLWVGFYFGGVGRFRDGRFTMFNEMGGAPGGHIGAFHLDGDGRLWIATGCCGLVRVADPDSEAPQFVSIDTDDGLTAQSIMCIAEDEFGRLYLGSSHGVDRYDPGTGRVRHFSREDGLLDNWVFLAHRDREGALWFGTSLGVSRLAPREDDDDFLPPPVRVHALSIAGVDRDLSPFGESRVAGLELTVHQREVAVEYSGLGFATGQALRFQHRVGGEGEAWSRPGAERKILLAGLSPGRHELQVRAIDTNGAVSPMPASVSFHIPPPFWRKWWFIFAAVLVVAVTGYAAHRQRLRRAVELERIRTRIATDLHDDIGSSLSQVSILSEVVRQQVGEAFPGAAGTLSQIAETARHLVDSMSDIVWAINPKRDRSADLVQRMRSFASDTFTAKRIAFRFHGEPEGQDRRLGIELRRQVFLIFKEAVNNAVRHSGCSQAEIAFQLGSRRLDLAVSDNGHGIDPERSADGHGLASMRERAKSLGGSLSIESQRGSGTAVRVTVPL